MICEIPVPVVSIISARMEYAVVETNKEGKQYVKLIADRMLFAAQAVTYLNRAFNEYGYTYRIIKI